MASGVLKTMLLVAGISAAVPATAAVVFTDTTGFTVHAMQVATGTDFSPIPDVTAGYGGALVPYTALGTFNCCGPNYGAPKMSDGAIGAGVISDGLYGIPNAGRLTLDFGDVHLLDGIAIYNGYGNRDDGTYVLHTVEGAALGTWTVFRTGGGTNYGTDSFWLEFNSTLITAGLVLDTTSADVANTNSYRQIQVFAANVPEPLSITLLATGLIALAGRRRA